MDCIFCGKVIEKGTGSINVNPAGKTQNFCSSKCRKNMLKLGRKPRKVKWTRIYREEKQIRVRDKAPAPEEPVKEVLPEKKTKKPAKAKPAKAKTKEKKAKKDKA